MSETSQSQMSGPDLGVLSRTAPALPIAMGRCDTRLVFLPAGVGYLVLYLVTVGYLALVNGTKWP